MENKVKIPMEQMLCPVLGIAWDTGNPLFDRTGKEKELEKKIVTGYAFCPEVQAELDKGQVVLVVIDPDKSHAENPEAPKENEAHRTGDFLYLDKETAYAIFGEDNFEEKPMAYIVQETYDTIVRAAGKVSLEDEDEQKLELD